MIPQMLSYLNTFLTYVLMLLQQGLITTDDRDVILNGLDEIKRLIEDGKFEWRKDRQDVHMNIEAALIDMVGEPAKKLHTARSRNDQVATDLRLWCRDAIGKILIHLRNLQVRFSVNCFVTYCYGKLVPVIVSTID